MSTPETNGPEYGAGPQPTPPRSATDGFFQWIRDRHLVRSDSDRWIGGVASGVARKLGVDPLIVRGVFFVSIFLGSIGFIAYGLAWALLPEERDGRIHAEELFRGRFDPAIIGAGALLIGGIIRPDNWGFGPWRWINTLVWIAAIVAVVVLISKGFHERRQSMPNPTQPTPPGPHGAVPPTAQFWAEGNGPAQPTPPPFPTAPQPPVPPAAPAVPYAPVTPEPSDAVPTPASDTDGHVDDDDAAPVADDAATAPLDDPITVTSPALGLTDSEPTVQITKPVSASTPAASVSTPAASSRSAGTPPPPPPNFGNYRGGPPITPTTPYVPMTPPLPTQPAVKGPGRSLAGIIVALCFFAIAGLVLADRFGYLWAELPAAIFGTCVVILGLGIVIAGFMGRRSGVLGALAIVLFIIGIPASVYNAELPDRFFSSGNDAWRPSSVESAEEGISTGAGNVIVDLTNLKTSSETITVPVNSIAGNVRVIVPTDKDVTIETRVLAGNINSSLDWESKNENRGDRSTRIYYTGESRPSKPDIVIDVDLTFGNLTIQEQS